MRKNGKIPPHFLYFLEDEGIEIIDFKSSNFSGKDSYDRIIIKFPYGIKTLDIQVIFDNLDHSSPPDFILIKDDKILIEYEEIIKDWNFKESSTLFYSLNKIKELYSQEQFRLLNVDLKNSLLVNNNNLDFDINSNPHLEINLNKTFNIFEYVDQIITKIKSRFTTYKQIPKSSLILELILNYGEHQDNLLKDKFNNHIILSYPVDLFIRSRNVNRAPIINIYIPLNYEMRFFMDVKTPHFVSISDFKISNEFYDLNKFWEYILKFENNLTEYFREMQIRESIINKILNANFGFPLEIDTFNFSKVSLYLNYSGNKNNNALHNSSMKGRIQTVSNNYNNPNCNFLLHFSFIDNKIEFQIVDCDLLRMIVKKKFDYSTDDREVENLLQSVLSNILEYIKLKKN